MGSLPVAEVPQTTLQSTTHLYSDHTKPLMDPIKTKQNRTLISYRVSSLHWSSRKGEEIPHFMSSSKGGFQMQKHHRLLSRALHIYIVTCHHSNPLMDQIKKQHHRTLFDLLPCEFLALVIQEIVGHLLSESVDEDLDRRDQVVAHLQSHLIDHLPEQCTRDVLDDLKQRETV